MAKVASLAFEELSWNDTYHTFQESLGAALVVGLFADVPSYRSMRLGSNDIGDIGRKINIKNIPPLSVCYGVQRSTKAGLTRHGLRLRLEYRNTVK